MKEDLFEIVPNVFVNRSDPKFIAKLLRYHPYDAFLHLRYAEVLLASGEHRQARYYYKKAARLGSAYAKEQLRHSNPFHGESTWELDNPSNRIGSGQFSALLVMLIFSSVLLLLLIFGFHG